MLAITEVQCAHRDTGGPALFLRLVSLTVRFRERWPTIRVNITHNIGKESVENVGILTHLCASVVRAMFQRRVVEVDGHAFLESIL